MRDLLPGTLAFLLVSGSGATRLAVGQSGKTAIAELAGLWKKEEYGPYAEEAPPVLKLIAVEHDTVTAAASGWMLAPPGEHDPGYYLTEEGEEFCYRVRGFDGTEVPWSAPDGLWAVKFTAAAAGRLLVGLWRPLSRGRGPESGPRLQQLALASLDPTCKEPTTTRFLTLVTPYYGGTKVQTGVAINPVYGTLYIADLADGASLTGRVRIHALDPRSLEVQWTATVEPPRSGLTDATRDLAVLLSVSGDGKLLMALSGTASLGGILAEKVAIFSARAGVAQGSLPNPAITGLWTVAAAAPAEGSRLAVSSFLESGQGGARKRRFLGLRLIDAEIDEAHPGVGPLGEPPTAQDGSLRELSPTAFVWSQARSGWLIAAASVEWARASSSWESAPSDVPLQGRHRPEVLGFIRIPKTWHRAGRPRIDEWSALQR